MVSLRLALLASCVACPAFGQQVPALIDTSATAVATTNIGGTTAAPRATPQGPPPSAPGQGSVPRAMPPPVDPVSPDKPLSPKEQVGLAVAKRWIVKQQTPHLDEDGVVHFNGRGQVFVVTAVDHITDIALAPGEIIAPPLHIGSSESWKFHPATSGSGRKTISHVLVKPIDAGLSTNMVIETNKRTISVALTSRRVDYMPLVSLDIPEDPDKEWSAATARLQADGQAATSPAVGGPCDQQPVITPDQFKIAGDDVTWRPVQAYVVSTPVGMKTCIEFPSSIGSEDLPALLALADDGGWFTDPTKKIVNVRFLRRRFIADEVLNRFILVDGVGSDQKSVTITRKK